MRRKDKEIKDRFYGQVSDGYWFWTGDFGSRGDRKEERS